jgi:ABC-2 type transport system permease protein
MPVIVQALIMGYAITTEVRNTPVTICDRDATPRSRSLVQSIAANPLFVFTGLAQSEEEVRRRIDHGEARLGVIIPRRFDRAMTGGEPARVAVVVDGQDANSSAVASGYLDAVVTSWAGGRLRRHLEGAGLAVAREHVPRVQPTVLFNPRLESTWYMVPALAVLLVTMITALLTGFSIVREKERGTLEQLMVTPITTPQLIMGKSIPFMIVGLVELSVVLLIAMLWFGIPFRGSYPALLLLAVVYMFSSIGVGILTSTVARTPHQSLFLIWFTLIFFILLSGFFIPVENMPWWVRQITRINPVRYFMFCVREMFLKGTGPASLWREGVAMLSIGCILYGTAMVAFRRRVR